jgi:RNA polymerase sigma factor (sigma-70 family)
MTPPPFQVFVDSHARELHRFLVAHVGAVDADDVLQETLLSAMRAYPRLRRDSDVRAWGFQIARNKALDLHRARAKRPLAVGAAEEVEAAGESPGRGGSATLAVDPADTLVAADADGALWAAVRELPEKQRAAVVLRHVVDLTHADIARVLDSSEPAARRSLHEGLAKLRARSATEGWTR